MPGSLQPFGMAGTRREEGAGPRGGARGSVSVGDAGGGVRAGAVTVRTLSCRAAAAPVVARAPLVPAANSSVLGGKFHGRGPPSMLSSNNSRLRVQG